MWFTETAEKASRNQLSFLHAAALSRGDQFRADLTQALADCGHSLSVVDCQANPRPWRENASFFLHPGSCLIIWRPELLGEGPELKYQIASLRPAVHESIRRGKMVIISSTKPKAWFPDPDGSSVIGEATKVRLPNATSELIGACEPSLDEEARTRIAKFSAGSITLAKELLKIELSEQSGNSKRSTAITSQKSLLRSALLELDPNTLAFLDRQIFELGRKLVPEDEAPASTVSLLVDSGLAYRIEHQISLFGDLDFTIARGCLEAVLEEQITPPPYALEAHALLFKYERLVRHILSRHLREHYGDLWKSHGLPSIMAKIEYSAKRSGIVTVDSEFGVANPLDWLTLEDLLSFAEDQCRMDQAVVGGLRLEEWVRHRTNVCPVRNRLAHVRIPRSEDVGVIRRNLEFLMHRCGIGHVA